MTASVRRGKAFSSPGGRFPASALNQAGQHPSPHYVFVPPAPGQQRLRVALKSQSHPPGQTGVHHLALRALLYLQAPQSLDDPSPVLQIDQALPRCVPRNCPVFAQLEEQQRAYHPALGCMRKSAGIGQHLLDLARVLVLAEDLWCWKQPAAKHGSTCSPLSRHRCGSPTACWDLP